MGTTPSPSHTRPDAEGIDKPYYAAEKSVEVLPRPRCNGGDDRYDRRLADGGPRHGTVPQLFHDAQFTVTTASGIQFRLHAPQHARRRAAYSSKATIDAQGYTGTARRQSQTGTRPRGLKVTCLRANARCHFAVRYAATFSHTSDAKVCGQASQRCPSRSADDSHSKTQADRLRVSPMGRYRRYPKKTLRNTNSKKI